MSYLDAIKARLGSVRNNDKTMLRIMKVSSAGYNLIAADMPQLIAIAEAADRLARFHKGIDGGWLIALKDALADLEAGYP